MPKKSLVVGLGGTGDWVLTFLKSRLFAAYGEEATKKDVQFLLADTIHAKAREDAFRGTRKITVGYSTDQHEETVAKLGQVRVENLEYLPLVGSIQETAVSIQAREPHARHLSWFPAGYYLNNLPQAAMDITLGAGQWRQFGRMALTLGTERGALTGKLRHLMREANVDADDDLMVYVICSLGGGTGAGMFLDAAAVIRDVAARTGLKVWIVGFLLLPGAFRKVWSDLVQRTAIPRSYAAFRELTRFQTVAGKNVPFPIRYSVNEQVALSSKLFDTVFLLDAVGELAEAPPWSGVSPSIADSLEVFIDRTCGSRILEHLVNASAEMAGQVQMNQTLPAQFHSIGSHKIVLPARQYAHIFTSQFAGEFFGRLFPSETVDGGLPALRKADIGDQAYAQLALESMKGIPNLFTRIVDYLPGRPDHVRLEAFANANVNVYRSLLVPEREEPGLSLALLDEDPLQRDNQDEPFPTCDLTNEEPEEAAKEVARVCKQRLELYWAKLNPVVERVKKRLDEDMASALEAQVTRILNADVSDPKAAALRAYPVGSAVAFLDQVALQCDALVEHVLSKTEERIRKRDFTPEQWQIRVNQSKTQMEAKFTGFFKRGRAASAQKAYINEVGKLAEGEKMALVFKTFHELTWMLKARANAVRESIVNWAKLATLDGVNSARVAAGQDIAVIKNALAEAGRSYTSSYGLSRYTGGEVDITMGGYQEKLYKRIAQPLVNVWVEGHGWQFQDHALTLSVTTPAHASTATTANINSGEALYRWAFKQAEGAILPQVTKLSIFDYFLEAFEGDEDRAQMPQLVAKFLKDNTHVLMDELQGLRGAQESRHIYLLVKRPAKPEAVDFYQNLVLNIKRFYSGTNEKFQEGIASDFDNPYTLTLLYLIQGILPGQVRLLNDYERRYYEAIAANDAHIVNHVFRCEQEAAKLEKVTNAALGQTGAEWTRIDPRACRLLNEPHRVKLFFQLLALKVICLAAPPNQSGTLVWMILPPGNEDPKGARVVWLTRPAEEGEEPSRGQSLLYAIERFCLTERSDKPGGEIEIRYDELARALNIKRSGLMADGGYDKLIAAYQTFLENELNDTLERYVELKFLDDNPSREELDTRRQQSGSLRIMASYYLEEEIRQLRANKNAQESFRADTLVPKGG
ncbi:MAG TPA: tubulin-like doman-containing protein [Pyrinomonadaceae bacterium]|nr:tubulin-like doman-containing protein [Pyrinomonadaceae bacterium]